MRLATISPLLLIGILVWARPTEARTEIFALVISNNQSLDPSVRRLKYADDDGARFYELVSTVSNRSVLLSVLDPESQKVFPGLARRSRVPSREELHDAMTGLRADILKAKAAGARTVLYFYYAGHGDVGQDREGYINLVDGKFSRSDLYREVIARSPADVNHLIIDACNAYFLVNRRGARGARAEQLEAIRSFLAQESLDRYPNTGVMLSTASMDETHEWSLYRSGIFSHQLLSALWGSADVDGNEIVDYREAAAYIAAANLKVTDARARLSIYTRPPRANLKAPLFDLRRLRRLEHGAARPARGRVAALLKIPRDLEGHYYLEDDRGVRYLDFNKSTEQPLTVAMLDRPYYYLRSQDQETMIRLQGETADVDASLLDFKEIPTQSRGSVEQSFRRDLYAFPFGRSFVMGYGAADGAEGGRLSPVVIRDQASAPWYGRAQTWKWLTAGATTAALATGITMQVLAGTAASELEAGEGQITMSRALELQDQSNSRRAVAGVAFGVAGAMAITSAILFIIDGDTLSASAGRSKAMNAVSLPGGGVLTLSGSF